MRVMSLGVLLIGTAASQLAAAGTFQLNLDAAGRLYLNESNVYAEIGKFGKEITVGDDEGLLSDGFYCLTAEPSPSACTAPDVQVGSGARVFKDDGNFASAGIVTYDDTSGAITGLTLNFAPFIDVTSTNPFGWGFAGTNVTGFSGSVLLVGGGVAGIDLNASVNLPLGFLPADTYSGTFSINGGSFTLDVDGSYASQLGTLALTVDLGGSVNNLAPIPEPSTYALFGAGALLVGAVVRRRTAVSRKEG